MTVRSSAVLAAFVLLGLVHGATECQESCLIPPMYNASNDVCSYYKFNQDWLPTAYAESAYCACHGVTGFYEDGWRSRSIGCVRAFLREGHESVPQEMKKEMIDLKQKYCNSVACDPRYLVWMEEHWVPVAYKLHVDSFRSCCCPTGPGGSPIIHWGCCLVLHFFSCA